MRIYQNYHKHDFGSNIIVPDCVCSQEDYAKKAVELGHGILSSVAHGWQNRYIDTFEIAKKYNLKFLFGTEAYWVKDRHQKDSTNSHIVLLAMNENGRRAINEILSIANEDGYYYQPRIDIELILSLPPQDVIVTTACVAYWRYEDIEDITLKFFKRFQNNFYLEVQPHPTDKQRIVNKRITLLANKYNIQLMAGCDTHYISMDKAWERDEYLASNGIKYEDEEGWLLDYVDGDTLFNRFVSQGVLTNAQIEEAISNTNVFLDVKDYDCECFQKNIKMPKAYFTKQGIDDDMIDSNLQDIIWDAWDSRKKDIDPNDYSKYEHEIGLEIQTILDTKHAPYFLINYEIIKLGKERGGIITPSSRGSGGSFYVNNLLGFTQIDRISASVKMFPERFMSKTRILETHSLADIDFNLGNPEVFAQAQQDILGYEHSQPMIAFGTYKPKNAWRMYARAKNIDNEIALKVSLAIGEYDKSLRYINDEDEREQVNVEDFIPKEYVDLFNDSKSYLGIYSDLKMSPCSYLLYDGNIKREIGLIRTKSNTGESHLCCIMDRNWADKYKFLKNDLLKVKSIELIYRVFDRIGITPFSVNALIRKTPPNDECWDIYSKGITMGINQVEQPLTKSKVMKYKPKNISELCAFIAAIRPGFQSMYSVFESRMPFNYGIHTFDKLIQTPEMPNSFVLYQETAMLAINYAGIPMDECYGIIKNISKKNSEEILKYKDRFINGFAGKIIEDEKISEDESQSIAHKVWEILEDSSNYSFNSAHAYAMSIDSLYLAWQKAHYPIEFYEVLLNMCLENAEKDRIVLVKREAEKFFGINFPSLQFGQDNTIIKANKEKNAITMSMATIKGFNTDISKNLFDVSKEFYASFVDLLLGLLFNKVGMSKVENLIKINYFDEYGDPAKLLLIYNEFVSGANRITKTLKQETINKRLKLLYRFEEDIVYNKISFKEQLKNDLEILGYIQSTFKNISNRYVYVLDIDKKPSPKVQVYCLKNGKISYLRFYQKQKNKIPFDKHDILYIDDTIKKPKVLYIDGEFIPSESEVEHWVSSYFSVSNIDKVICESI